MAKRNVKILFHAHVRLYYKQKCYKTCFDNAQSNATNQKIITDAICYFCQSVGIQWSNHHYIRPSPQLDVQYWISTVTPHLVTGIQYSAVVHQHHQQINIHICILFIYVIFKTSDGRISITWHTVTDCAFVCARLSLKKLNTVLNINRQLILVIKVQMWNNDNNN